MGPEYQQGNPLSRHVTSLAAISGELWRTVTGPALVVSSTLATILTARK